MQAYDGETLETIRYLNIFFLVASDSIGGEATYVVVMSK